MYGVCVHRQLNPYMGMIVSRSDTHDTVQPVAAEMNVRAVLGANTPGRRQQLAPLYDSPGVPPVVRLTAIIGMLGLWSGDYGKA